MHYPVARLCMPSQLAASPAWMCQRKPTGHMTTIGCHKNTCMLFRSLNEVHFRPEHTQRSAQKSLQLHAKRGVKKAGLLGKNVLLPPLQHPDWLVTPDSLKCDNCIPLTPSSYPLHTHTHEGSSWRDGHCAREWKGDVVTCLSKQFKIAIYY